MAGPKPTHLNRGRARLWWACLFLGVPALLDAQNVGVGRPGVLHPPDWEDAISIVAVGDVMLGSWVTAT